MKRIATLIMVFSSLTVGSAFTQIDSTLLKRIPQDTSKAKLNMEAIYNRPFLTFGKVPVALGGYMEVNWQHLGTDGVSDGHQFQFRRMTLFAASSIGRRLRFLSELEFEDGAREISVEFAALDLELHSLLNLRAGMILNPIGAFNQNHDGPKWEFTDRPISATQMLPATWNNAGFGIFGKHYANNWMMGYELYLSGGFDNSIIANDQNRTYLPAAKANRDRFEEIASGLPLVTGKVAVRHKRIAEVGLSYMGGVYNAFQNDGVVLDSKRRCDVFAVDVNSTLPKIGTTLVGEWAWVFVDVPSTYSQQFGSRQHGGFLDVIQPILRRPFLGWDKATLNLAARFEYVDWNVGKFRETGGNISDDLWSIMPAVSFRPSPLTVLRLNYRFQKQQDILGNPPATTGGWNFGVSTYF
jgi:hypothetical protein